MNMGKNSNRGRNRTDKPEVKPEPKTAETETNAMDKGPAPEGTGTEANAGAMVPTGDSTSGNEGGDSTKPADKPAPVAKAGRDPQRTHFASFAAVQYFGKGHKPVGQTAPQYAMQRAGTKGDLAVLALMGQSRDGDGNAVADARYAQGVTVQAFAAMLQGFGPQSRADLAYARTWAARSYVGARWGIGVIAKSDTDGVQRLYGVRHLASGVVVAHPALTLAEVQAVMPAVAARDDGVWHVPGSTEADRAATA